VLPTYRLYGLTIQTPLILPCRSEDVREPDVTMRPASPAQFSRLRRQNNIPDRSRSWFLHRRLDDGNRYLRWSGSFEFVVSADGRQILYRRLNGSSMESLSTYLLGHVLSFSLLAFGVEPLHATAVCIDGKAIALLGDCGCGKSTLAAALMARGASLVTDDLMVLQPSGCGWIVHPGMPRLKLFPQPARKLLKYDGSRPTMIRGTSKLIVSLGGDQAVRQAAHVAGLYVLAPPGSRRERVRSEVLAGSESLLEIVRAAFNLVVTDRPRMTAQFAAAGRLAAGVPVRRLSYPRVFSALPDVCDAVFADLGITAATRNTPKGSSETTQRPAASHSSDIS
jgi:hypothetical protein